MLVRRNMMGLFPFRGVILRLETQFMLTLLIEKWVNWLSYLSQSDNGLADLLYGVVGFSFPTDKDHTIKSR